MSNLTSKELTAIEDQLGMEQLLVKKFNSVASTTGDSELRTKCEKIAKKHQQHYNTLLGHLN